MSKPDPITTKCTRMFRDTVAARASVDPEFREALAEEYLEATQNQAGPHAPEDSEPQTAAPDLLPCPFCGTAAVYDQHPWDGHSPIHAGCHKCEVWFGAYQRDAAADLWNRRACK